MALQLQQLQGQKPKSTAGPSLLHPTRDQQNTGPEIDVSLAVNWGSGERIVLQPFVQIL